MAGRSFAEFQKKRKKCSGTKVGAGIFGNNRGRLQGPMGIHGGGNWAKKGTTRRVGSGLLDFDRGKANAEFRKSLTKPRVNRKRGKTQKTEVRIIKAQKKKSCGC